MNNFKFICLFIIFCIWGMSLHSSNIEIKVKVQNEIITNVDIEKEVKYLLFLNPRLSELENTKIKEIAKNSLVTEIIKKNELEKYHDFSKVSNFIDIIEKKFLKRNGISSKTEFREILKQKNLSYMEIQKKLQVETLWNQLIYNKYSNNIKVNKKYLREKILRQFENENIKYEYNLSEIIFTENIDESLNDALDKLNKSINDIGFENTANIFSVSSTAKNGGLIGWINELQISENIKKNIINLNISEVSKPIKMQGGYLLIKINDKREYKNQIDLENQLKELIDKEMNRQLNAFSIIFYKKLKKNIIINEL
tara:strand:- start:241 stop:1173 length:933 start_codon:yes stop_codon:yes gene_type:complete